MRQITQEWVQNAEGDYAVVERESRVRDNPSYEAVCFHAQQYTEKYLKARLSEAGIEFAKVHDLVALLDQALDVEPLWEAYLTDLAFLSDFAVSFRYPGESAGREDALDARRRCRIFRKAAREALGLPV